MLPNMLPKKNEAPEIELANEKNLENFQKNFLMSSDDDIKEYEEYLRRYNFSEMNCPFNNFLFLNSKGKKTFSGMELGAL